MQNPIPTLILAATCVFVASFNPSIERQPHDPLPEQAPVEITRKPAMPTTTSSSSSSHLDRLDLGIERKPRR
jgi:hypothetical protein